jgi:hypothetical protein
MPRGAHPKREVIEQQVIQRDDEEGHDAEEVQHSGGEGAE